VLGDVVFQGFHQFGDATQDTAAQARRVATALGKRVFYFLTGFCFESSGLVAWTRRLI
jgi:hypothetical protein